MNDIEVLPDQLDIFTIDKETQAKEVRRSIRKKLEHYGIDDYYEKNIKGNQMLLSVIKEKLETLPNYKEYLYELIDILKHAYPITKSMTDADEQRINSIYPVDSLGEPYYRFYCLTVFGDSIASSGPIFCLSSIPDDFFVNEE